MPSQNRKDPFHVNRDVARDNVRVVRKVRLPRGGQIYARTQYASADNSGGTVTVDMPYTGHLFLTVTGGSFVIINNPFVSGPGTSLPIVMSPAIRPISSLFPGQIFLPDDGGGLPIGTYEIIVGRATDARIPNNYSQ